MNASNAVTHLRYSFSLIGFLWFWGILIAIITIAIAIFKHENREEESKDQHGVITTYKLVWNILKMPTIQIMAILQLTVYVCWADYEGVGYFKFLDAGISNEKMIPLSSISIFIIRLLVPVALIRYTAKAKSMGIYLKTMHYRSILCLTGALIIWLTPKLIPADGIAPNYVYVLFLFNDALFMFTMFAMRLALNAFFMAKSDPVVAGTYITLLNTIDNFGGMWPIPTALWMVEKMTWRDCPIDLPLTNRTNVCNAFKNV